jgi:hypothetical protein
MKGTAYPAHLQRAQLRASTKDRAENLMIVDLLRNDLGRIAENGSVKVDSLFEIEDYPTVWQMVSSVSARIWGVIAPCFAGTFPLWFDYRGTQDPRHADCGLNLSLRRADSIPVRSAGSLRMAISGSMWRFVRWSWPGLLPRQAGDWQWHCRRFQSRC